MRRSRPDQDLHPTWIIDRDGEEEARDAHLVGVLTAACDELGGAELARRLERVSTDGRVSTPLDAALARLARLLGSHAGEVEALGVVDRELLDVASRTFPSPQGERAREILHGGAGIVRASVEVGPYSLLDQIGTGSFGVVYRARHRGSKQIVALKMLRLDSLTPAHVASFRKEARVASSLDHPGIVRIVDSGVWEDGMLTVPWIASELVEGKNLRDAARGRDLEGVLEIFAALCDAMAHAHERGVVHRDLKPQNVLVDEEGGPHVLDFGIARGEGVGGSLATRSGAMLGTPAYMAPEVVRLGALAASCASDVWALGAMLFELLTGEMPYGGENLSPQDVLRRAAIGSFRRVTEVGRDVPRDLASIVETAMAFEPERRYGTAAGLRDDVRRFLAGRKVAARSPSLFREMLRVARRHRTIAIATAFGAALAVIGGATSFMLWQRAAFAEERLRVAVSGSFEAFVSMTEAFSALHETMGNDGRVQEMLAASLDSLDELQRAGIVPRDGSWLDLESRMLEIEGDVAMRARDLATVREGRQRVLEIERRRSREAGGSSRRLAQALVKRGDLARAEGDLAVMRSVYEEAHEIYGRIMAANPEDQTAQDDFGWSLERLSYAYRQPPVDLELSTALMKDRLERARAQLARWPGFRARHNFVAAVMRWVDARFENGTRTESEVGLLQEALGILDEMIAEQPDRRVLHLLRLGALSSLSREYSLAGNAVESLDLARKLAEEAVKAHRRLPTDADFTVRAFTACIERLCAEEPGSEAAREAGKVACSVAEEAAPVLGRDRIVWLLDSLESSQVRDGMALVRRLLKSMKD